MTLVMLAAVLLVAAALAGAWSHHRRTELAGWQHELDEAFGVADREPLSRHRSLRSYDGLAPRSSAQDEHDAGA